LPAPQRTLQDFFREFTAQWVRSNPNLATSSRYFTGPEQDRIERQLTPVTTAWRRDRIRLARVGLTELQKFDRSRISETERVSADLMAWLLDAVVREEPFLDFSFPFEQFGGVNVGLVNTLTVGHPLLNERDALNYLARLGLVSARIEEAITESRRLAGKGMVPPKFILQATIAQMKQFISSPPAQNPFVTAFVERTRAVKSIPDAKREELQMQAERIVRTQVYPAWQRAIALLEPFVDRATDDAGLWRFSSGSEAYAFSLRRFTSTNLTAEAIHQIGLREVERIEKEMDSILRGLGRTDGSVKDRIEQLRKDQVYPLTEEGRKLIMADVESIMRDSEKRAAILFDKRPKAPVVAQPYPQFREANAAASYNAPAPDGSRPGTFQIPLRPERMTKFGLRSLIYHETVPGHHFQIALEMENTALPRFRQIRALGGISALSEGWALYAERLAAESGWYTDDRTGLLGQLDDELFRARRLVVDTGIHAKHWTRQQAIDYGIEPSEVERYVVNPGQACAYMVGELKILELRDKARKTLGDRFSLQQFHNAVLGAGTVPLEILEHQVDAYIRSTAGR
jgi:uncharacterized protein (DUF885 family)